MDVKDKVVVVTGSGRGLGRAMAVEFAKKGAKIAVVDLDQTAVNETVQLCKEAGGDGKAYLVNVAKEEQVEKLMNDVVADFGRLDGLINNAGILRDAMLVKFDKDGKFEKKMSLEQWQSVIDVNLTGVFLCGREAAQKMVELGNGGVIINISSISKNGNPGQSNYSAAKAGVASMATLWGKELARYNIRTGYICPGFIKTEMVASMKPEALEKAAAGIPLKRLGAPENIAHACLFIFENDYFTSRGIEIDGGLGI